MRLETLISLANRSRVLYLEKITGCSLGLEITQHHGRHVPPDQIIDVICAEIRAGHRVRERRAMRAVSAVEWAGLFRPRGLGGEKWSIICVRVLIRMKPGDG